MVGDASKLVLVKELLTHNPLDYIKYKIRATFRKPDMDYIVHNLFIGGQTSKIPLDFIVYNIRYLPEGETFDVKLLESIVDDIKIDIVNNKKVFVHCRHGRGRSPMVACAYIIKYSKLNVSEAMYYVSHNRPNTCINKQQIKVLEEFRSRCK